MAFGELCKALRAGCGANIVSSEHCWSPGSDVQMTTVPSTEPVANRGRGDWWSQATLVKGAILLSGSRDVLRA